MARVVFYRGESPAERVREEAKAEAREKAANHRLLVGMVAWVGFAITVRVRYIHFLFHRPVRLWVVGLLIGIEWLIWHYYALVAEDESSVALRNLALAGLLGVLVAVLIS